MKWMLLAACELEDSLTLIGYDFLIQQLLPSLHVLCPLPLLYDVLESKDALVVEVTTKEIANQECVVLYQDSWYWFLQIYRWGTKALD